MDAFLAWFDLDGSVASVGPGTILGPASADEIPITQQVLLYAIVVVGVLLAESVAMARRGGPVSVDLTWPWVAVACVIALVVFPAVWREIGVMSDASPIVQMGLAVQGGVFWGVLVAGAEKQVHPE